MLVTALDAPALQEGLLPVLSSLTSRHVVALAVGRTVLGADGRGRGTVEAAYDPAATERDGRAAGG